MNENNDKSLFVRTNDMRKTLIMNKRGITVKGYFYTDNWEGFKNE